MIESGHATLLQQAHRNNWQRYLTSLQAGDSAAGSTGWDICVLTAGDERQAAMYRRQLAQRREAGLLPPRTRFVVAADPPGRRIGSGGATLRLLATLDELLSQPQEPDPNHGVAPCVPGACRAARTLIIHSGGDSRRLPHSSAVGKLFTRVPRVLPDGRASTLFDEFLISLSGVSNAVPPGVLIASGDVLLIFDHLQLSFQRAGVIGVAAAAPAAMGTRHGVYVRGERGHRVRAYLHKPGPDLLQAWQAVQDGTVQIDTGFVWLDAPTAARFEALARQEPVARLCGLAPAPAGTAGTLNLYGDLLLPLAESTSFDTYLADTSDGPATPDVQAARRVIWADVRADVPAVAPADARAVAPVPFSVEHLQPAVFIHFGTSREYWQTTLAEPVLRRICGWTPRAAAWPAAWPDADGPSDDASNDGPVLIDAVLDGPIVPANAPALVLDSHLGASFACRGPGIVAGVRTSEPLSLEADVVVHQLPVEDGASQGFVTRVFGMDDDPKRRWGDASARFMGRSWQAWLAEADLPASALWPDLPEAERTLWNARLYPLCADRAESLRLALPLQNPREAPAGWRAAWLAAPRSSLGESFARAASERILTDTAEVEDEVAESRFYGAIVAEQDAAEARLLLGNPAAVQRRCRHVAERLARADALVQLRGYQALALASGQVEWENRAFALLAEMIRTTVVGTRVMGQGGATTAHGATRKPSHERAREPAHGRAVRVEAAARIDFGGGWTDTPPYSIERGGTVLNAAILLHGAHGAHSAHNAYPLAAEAALLPEPVLVLESRDIDTVVQPASVGELMDYTNPADPFALLKAALLVRGLVPAGLDPRTPVRDVMCAFGSGLRLSTETCVPRGSGLGISSVLAGAVLISLGRLCGEEIPQDRLFDEVLLLEQALTTGGGWQDQVGGLTGGVKLVTTAPGLPQQIRVDPLAMPAQARAELAERLLLIYTGQQRLAKNLLRSMMRQWMAREPRIIRAMAEMPRLATAMRDALLAGRLDEFGRLLGQHWELNKRMDPGSSNPFIDELFAVMQPYIHGGKLAGAGGGGYAIALARDAQAARDLAAVLAARFAGTSVEASLCEIPELPIRVTER